MSLVEPKPGSVKLTPGPHEIRYDTNPSDMDPADAYEEPGRSWMTVEASAPHVPRQVWEWDPALGCYRYKRQCRWFFMGPTSPPSGGWMRESYDEEGNLLGESSGTWAAVSA